MKQNRLEKNLLFLVLIVAIIILNIFFIESSFAEGSEVIERTKSSSPVTDLGGLSNEEAFEQYIYKTMNLTQNSVGPTLKLRGSTAGDRLGTVAKKLYNVLKTRISSVAAGQLSSSVFSFTMSETGLSANDINELFDSFDEIIDALLADCPYELYWYDKTKDRDIYYSSIGLLTISLPVAKDYSKDHTTGTYETDPSLIQTVQKAASNALKIVNANAGKTDYEKLLAYKNAICSMTDYNDAAADDDTMPYGDPWQLIHVFDGDSSTKVVCEGYAKAFQYLCDLSTFSDVSVISVSGYMQDITGAQRHMWNIVTTGGKNYLTDITNSDSDFVGSDGSLFMAGYENYNSNEDYYTYVANNEYIFYWYDTNMTTLFDTSNLLLSATAYPASPTLILPKNLQSIGDEAFANIKNITVIAPVSMKNKIPASAFDSSVTIQYK